MRLLPYAGILILFLSRFALGSNLPIQNSSFELDTPTSGASDVNGERWTILAPTGWTGFATGSQVFGTDDPANAQYTGTGQNNTQGNLPGTADGVQEAYINLGQGGGSFGTLTYSGTSLGNFIAGVTYNLIVAIGQRKDTLSGTDSITLLDSGNPVGTAVSGSPTTDTFTDLVYTYTPLTNGGPIGIRLTATQTGTAFEQSNFDNVRLTTSTPTSAAPEPATLSLVTGAALILLARLRRSAR